MRLANRFVYSCILLFLFSSLVVNSFAQSQSLNRDEIDDKYKWNLTDIYPDWESWESDLKQLEAKMDEFAALKGTLSNGPEALLKAFTMDDELSMIAYKVYRYPQFTRDVDTRNQDASAKLQQVTILFSKFNTATAWLNPELLEIPWETMKTWLDKTPALAPYRFGIEDLYRQQAHVLDEEKEKLLSYYSRFGSTPSSIYQELSTSDIQFPEVEMSDGEEVTMTRGTYGKILATNRNQEDRKLAFENHYGVYKENENTYAAIYNAVCQRNWASAQARDYSSCIEAALEGNNVPVSVYENLISTVKDNSQPLQKYVALRKKVLGLENYHLYDGSISLVDVDKTYPYEEAQEWVLASVDPLGKDYKKKLSKALEGGWIDVFENTGKRPGAYSANVYGVHPYMLLNYNETLDNVFTLAHELGHTMHTTLSNENQPFATSSYTIFVAEVASTLNERLLLDYMLNQTDDPKERINLLQQAIDNIVGTFYAQVMFADFELQVHQMVEQGRPITALTLNQVFRELYKDYYGDALVFDDLYEVIWARISHFYQVPFYVYQYATCFASSAQLYSNITDGSKKEKKEALNKYITLLQSGGNDYPMEQLKQAGVDLTQKEPVLAIAQQLDNLVDQLETELEKLN
jgi:oligoendopeptidase F